MPDIERNESFLYAISDGYYPDIPYHSDLHGADTMSMANYFLIECKMAEVLNLSKFDCLTFLVSALVHDLGHGGLNNSYHVNAITDIAINSNNLSVMEHFHAA